MSANQDVFFTFHKIRQECEEGSPQAWEAFLDFYGPLCLKLLEIYGSPSEEISCEVLKSALQQLCANGFEPFRSTSRQSEREFLLDIRRPLLKAAADRYTTPNPSASNGRAPEFENLGAFLADLPFLHQEMLFLKLAGYTDTTLENMLRVSPRVAEKAFQRLNDYPAASKATSDRCAWPAEWLSILHRAREAKTETCPALHQFVRIHDGQVSWYDKEPVEKHVSGCLHCLESWTALREVAYWRRNAPSISTTLKGQLLEAVPTPKVGSPKKSLLARFFS